MQFGNRAPINNNVNVDKVPFLFVLASANSHP